MRKWFASLAVLGLAVTAASAQTLNPCIGFETVGYDDGGAESAWKVAAPTGAGDAFNVDFNTDAAGRDILGVSMSAEATGSGSGLLYIAICGDAAFDGTGHTPDLGSPLSILNNPTPVPNVASGFCPGFVAYDLPDINTGVGLHAVMNFPTGDSVTWLCADQSSVAGRSYFTTNSYSTPAVPFTLNWMMRLAAGPNFGGAGGVFTINGGTAVTVSQNTQVSLTFWSSCATQPTLYMQMLNVGTSLIAVPGVVLQTGLLNGSPTGALANAGILCGNLPCAAPVGATIVFSAFYADNCSLKKNGNPNIFLTNTASFTVQGNCSCNPCVAYGQKDDGVLDGTIWKVQNPAGTADYFNVNLGANSCATNALNVEAASWDFCGSGPCWAEVGLYNANLTLDPTGGTPLLPALTSVGGASACMAPGSATWGYPATVYDFPDFALGTSAYHIATKWASSDSCTWIASDTDAADDPSCGHGSIPSTASYFTVDAYATPAILFSATNWMMKLNWN